MKKALLYLIALMVYSAANATNYYISSSSGNDKNNGNSANSAWKTIAKLNSARWNLQPGDSVLFKCNDTLAGQLVPSRSGTAGKYIYYGSYGSGNKPILSGTTKVSSWTETSTNIWEATCPDCGNTVTNFFINGIAQQIGRWPNVTDPNKGYRTYESHSGSNQITDNELTDAINWTGAEAVVRTNRWVLDRLTIKSHVGNTLQFTTNASHEFLDNFGYFIQNDPRTLDQQGEWYYNPKNKKFSLYSNFDPNTLSTCATKFDTLLNIASLNYITVENLHFDGSCTATMIIPLSSHINIRNNEITNSGENAVLMDYSNYVIFENNLVNHTNNKVIRQYLCNNFIMRNNIIKNTALIAGMGLSADGQYLAVDQQGNDALIENNSVDSTGYIGIYFEGDTILVQNNVVSNYGMTVDDVGGLYAYGRDGSITHYSRKVVGNIIYNGIGALAGTDSGYLATVGIYMDDRTDNVDIIDNTLFNCPRGGIFLHNSNHINVKGNTSYNNGCQLLFQHDIGSPTFPIKNCTIDSNIFVSKQSNQPVAFLQTVDNGISDFGNFDFNYYCRPFDDNFVINLEYINGIQIDESHTLSSWSLKYNKDKHSGKSPIAVKEYTVINTVPPNLITNGAFQNDINNWSCWSPYNNCLISLAVGEGYPGNALKATFPTPSGKTDGSMFIISNNFSLTKDKLYRIKFAARSSMANNTLIVIPKQNGYNYKPIADVKVFALDTVYKQFEYFFTQDSTVVNARVDFQFNEGQGDLWLDSIEVIEVHAVKANPDDYIRFEYNATKNDKSISLTDTLVDVKGMPVSGNITLKPFTSVILFKKICSGIIPARPDTILGNLNVCPGTSNTYSIAAVPGATYYTWKLPKGWTGTSTGNSITAVAGDTGGIISVIARNVCDSSSARTINVTVNNIPATPLITMNNGILQSTATNGNQWYFNNNIITNATSDTYVPTVEGNYYAVVILNGCPSKPSDIFTNISELIIKKVSVPPVINNTTIDTSAWGGISEIQGARWSGTPFAGFASGFKMCYDTGNLYVLVSVQDSTPHSTANNSLPTWNNDDVELFFQMDTFSNPDGSYTTGDYQLRKERDVNYPAGFDGEFDNTFTPGGSSQTDFTNNTGMKIAEFDNGKVYYQEWQIPWQLLTKGLVYNSSSPTTPGSSWDGQHFKWDMQAADNVDGSGRLASIFVFNNSNSDYFDTRGFGKIKLETPITVPDAAGVITGTAIVCKGASDVTYTVPDIAGATSYVWSLPTGATGTSATNSISVSYGSTAVSGNIIVKGHNDCGDGSESELAVTVNSVPDVAGSITGTTSVCKGSTGITYSVPAITGATSYVWTLPAGATGTSTTNNISVNYGSTATSGNIIVKGHNSCGDGTESSFAVIVNEIPVKPVITLNNGTLQSNATNGNQWYYNTNIIQNATNATYIPSLKGNYYVIVTLNNCSSQQSNVISFNPVVIDETFDNNGISVYPNPTTDVLKISINNPFDFDYTIEICDNVGVLLQILKKSKFETSFELDLNKFSSGFYLLRIYSSNRYYQTMVIKR